MIKTQVLLLTLIMASSLCLHASETGAAAAAASSADESADARATSASRTVTTPRSSVTIKPDQSTSGNVRTAKDMSADLEAFASDPSARLDLQTSGLAVNALLLSDLKDTGLIERAIKRPLAEGLPPIISDQFLRALVRRITATKTLEEANAIAGPAQSLAVACIDRIKELMGETPFGFGYSPSSLYCLIMDFVASHEKHPEIIAALTPALAEILPHLPAMYSPLDPRAFAGAVGTDREREARIEAISNIIPDKMYQELRDSFSRQTVCCARILAENGLYQALRDMADAMDPAEANAPEIKAAVERVTGDAGAGGAAAASAAGSA